MNILLDRVKIPIQFKISAFTQLSGLPSCQKNLIGSSGFLFDKPILIITYQSGVF